MTADDGALVFGDQRVLPGECRDLELEVSQSYSGKPVGLPLRVERAERPGPVVLVIGAIHGDELNGTGIVRELITHRAEPLDAGSLVLVPVINILGFERLSRYLPDRRDPNRCFPGSATGSLSSRFAHAVFQALVPPSDLCIDFHTAAVRRTNFPNIRADLSDPEVRRIARAFGCPLIVDHPGIERSFRRAACDAGCPTITIEAGEAWKIEPAVVAFGMRGVRNVLIELKMVAGRREPAAYLAETKESSWLRAETGGVLSFHAGPGDVVEAEQPIAAVTTLLGAEQSVLHAPRDGVVLGVTTLPAVKPGDPVCHLAYPIDGIASIRKALRRVPDESLHERLREDLATNVAVTEPSEEGWGS